MYSIGIALIQIDRSLTFRAPTLSLFYLQVTNGKPTDIDIAN